MNIIPLALYIHIPWCIKKCPYCDFNSHVARNEIPESRYLEALITDFQQQLPHLQERLIDTVFIGGGTPSLMSPSFYDALLGEIKPHLTKNAEITLEANPGTIDFSSSIADSKFHAYRKIGINRLSIGVQSLQNEKLKYLGRMHSDKNALEAIRLAKAAGFDNFNCDLMFGLTNQTIDDAIDDLNGIIAENPTHISWYQLTIEPNTHFYRRPPTLPTDDYIFEIQKTGQALLAENNYEQYEVSAYARPNKRCQHNLNYWQFGDYIGIGAGAHGKITSKNPFKILRTQTPKHPRLYLETKEKHQSHVIRSSEYTFEFMLNALRLEGPISFELAQKHANISKTTIVNSLKPYASQNLITFHEASFELTKKGHLFANTILETFV